MTLLCYLIAFLLNVFWLWQGDKLSVSAQMVLLILTVAATGFGVILRLGKLNGTERKRYSKRAVWALFIYYIAILSVLLFFGGLFHLDLAWGGTVNLKPFYTIHRFLIHYKRTGSLSSLSNLLGNVIILVPLGVLLPVLFRRLRHFWLTLPLLALIAVGVEFIQWRTGTGVADIDDSILNFVGAVAGYFWIRMWQMLWQRFKPR